ncbi:hypothetical protein QNH47_12095 [Virgibacillus halodenitrificans]|uniref:hypothetical protein n=1 Tax=Virgibacillus halodenitrificans TaxID=1482 RepID=UPI0024BF1F8C|nr:hypothetical protein [Virgibacillus halodenitrificans]WHX24925.1 hypothetical protein QNH47_12095 [Virgibacillus halodenitrificans]
MNLVDLMNESQEERMQRFNRERMMKWRKEGEQLLERRKKLKLTRAYISRQTSIGYTRLTRLEEGLPIRDAKIIIKAYEMVLEIEEMNIENTVLLQQLNNLTTN